VNDTTTDEGTEMGQNGDGDNHGKPIDLSKQRWVVSARFIYSALGLFLFALYWTVLGTIGLISMVDEFRKLSNVVQNSVMSYQKQNAEYQRYDANTSARNLCIADWEAKNRTFPLVNLDGRCDNRIAVFRDARDFGDADVR
jgi:cell division protein FtsL